jgi:membrane associated rhomboid family serine protease
MIPLKDDNPSGHFPFATSLIILLNLVVFIYQFTLGQGAQDFIWKYAVVAKTLTTFTPVHPASTLFPPLTLITSQFLHGGLVHILFNLLFLWVFGDNIEAKLGFIRFIIFYLVCGILSGIIQVITFPNTAMPLIGASGAIAGVMGAYFLRFPRARVHTLLFAFIFIRVVRIPAIVFLGIWLIFQILAGAPTLGADEGGVAYFAHIGGFFCGMILFKIWGK